MKTRAGSHAVHVCAAVFAALFCHAVAHAQCSPTDSTETAVETGVFGMATDAAGNVFLYDSGNVVRKFSPAGDPGPTCCEAPVGSAYSGIAIDPSGAIVLVMNEFDVGLLKYVGSVQKYSSTGDFLMSWPAGGAGNLPARAVAVDADGLIYVVAADSDRVEKYSSTGTLLDTWGSSGTALGQFQNPDEITAGGGFVYVHDFTQGITKFSTDGTPIERQMRFGMIGATATHLYVANYDFGGNHLEVYTHAGALACSVRFGSSPLDFNLILAAHACGNGAELHFGLQQTSGYKKYQFCSLSPVLGTSWGVLKSLYR